MPKIGLRIRRSPVRAGPGAPKNPRAVSYRYFSHPSLLSAKFADLLLLFPTHFNAFPKILRLMVRAVSLLNSFSLGDKLFVCQLPKAMQNGLTE
jgi:hypothetical protein